MDPFSALMGSAAPAMGALGGGPPAGPSAESSADQKVRTGGKTSSKGAKLTVKGKGGITTNTGLDEAATANSFSPWLIVALIVGALLAVFLVIVVLK